jgi:hypothetical protein
MHLSPRERADFDEIVAQLRMEDTSAAADAPQHSITLLMSVVVALLGFTIGLAAFVHRPEILIPLVVLAVLLGGGLIARKVGRTHPASG